MKSGIVRPLNCRRRPARFCRDRWPRTDAVDGVGVVDAYEDSRHFVFRATEAVPTEVPWAVAANAAKSSSRGTPVSSSPGRTSCNHARVAPHRPGPAAVKQAKPTWPNPMVFPVALRNVHTHPDTAPARDQSHQLWLRSLSLRSGRKSPAPFHPTAGPFD